VTATSASTQLVSGGIVTSVILFTVVTVVVAIIVCTADHVIGVRGVQSIQEHIHDHILFRSSVLVETTWI